MLRSFSIFSKKAQIYLFGLLLLLIPVSLHALNQNDIIIKKSECLESERDCAGKCFGIANIQSDGQCRITNDRNSYSIFDNGSLRFGNANGTGITESSFNETENSVNELGNLRQPFYFDQSNNVWYKLIIEIFGMTYR